MTIVESGNVDVDVERGARWSFPLYLLASLATVYFLISTGVSGGDTDDLMRMIEVKRFVNGAGWFDLSFPSIQMPEVYVTPWSRLIDLPYASIAWALAPLTGPDQALDLAFNVWPPVMLGLYALAAVGALHHLGPLKADLPLSAQICLFLASLLPIREFAPGRVDHHNVQIILLVMLVYGLARWDRLGGWIAGVSIAVSVAVGLEALPVLVAALVAVCAAWSLKADRSADILSAVGLSCAASAVVLMIVTIHPAAYFVMKSDAFSAPYAEALIGFGLVTTLVTRAFRHSEAFLPRVAALILGGSIVSTGILWQFPAMLDGPVPMINGLAGLYWFDRIDQEKSALALFELGESLAVLYLLIEISILVIAAPKIVHCIGRRQPMLPVIYLVAVAAVVSSCMTVRFLRISPAVVMLLLPIAIGVLRSQIHSGKTKRLLIGVLVVIFAASTTRLFAFPSPEKIHDAFDFFVMKDCNNKNFADIRELTPGRMMTSPSLGLQIISHDPGEISVSSVSLHRSSPSISNVLAVMMGRTASENSALLKDFDYLALCRPPLGVLNEDKLPLLAALLSGQAVPGLTAVTGPTAAIMIFRIDHEALK